MEFPDKCIAPLPKDSFDRIRAVLRDGEDRTDFIREAVERELERRSHSARVVPNEPGSGT